MILALILGFLLGATAIVFILQNTTTVAVTFLSYQFTTSVAVVVLIAILVGFILAVLLVLPGLIGRSFRIRKLRKHNEALAKEAEFQKRSADGTAARLAEVENQNGPTMSGDFN